MGIDFLNIPHGHPRVDQQLVADAQAGGGDDGQIPLQEELVHRPDGAVGAVLYGQHAKLAGPGFHGVGHALEGADVGDPPPGEDAVAGGLGVGALHPLAGHQTVLGKEASSGAEGGFHQLLDLGGGADQLGLAGPGQLKQGGEQVVGIPLLRTGPLRRFGQDGPLPLLI